MRGLIMIQKGPCIVLQLLFALSCILLACTSQSTPPAVQVSTPTQLQNAVKANVDHIVISGHMDLFDLQFSGNTEALLTARGTKTIRVCSQRLRMCLKL